MDAAIKKSREATLARADGVVWSRNLINHTTPSAPSKEASRLLLDVAATPPRLRRGVFALFQIIHSFFARQHRQLFVKNG